MFLRVSLISLSAVSLAACGSGSGGGGTVTLGASDVPQIYPSNFRDGSNIDYDALEDGLVVYIGGQDGSVSEFRVTIDRMGTAGDATDDVLFVERNGGAARAFQPFRVDFDNGVDDLAITWRADNGDFFTVATESVNPAFDGEVDPEYLFASFTTGDGASEVRGFGGGGLETAVADLPSEASYQGEYALFSATSSLEIIGGATMDVNFGNGQITGTHDGRMDVGGVSGVVNGAVSGARVAGTMSVTGDAEGTLNFGGSLTGPSGARMVLGIGGTVDPGTGPETLGGRGLLLQPFGAVSDGG